MGLALYDPLRGVIRFPAGAAAISRASEAGFRSGPADIAKVKKIAGMMWEPVSYTHLDVYKRQPWTYA